MGTGDSPSGASASSDPVPAMVLGRGRRATVLADRGTALKVWAPGDARAETEARREAAVLEALAAQGLPVPACLGVERRGTGWALRLELIAGPTWGAAWLSRDAEAATDVTDAGDPLRAMAAALARVHARILGSRAPAGLPRLKDRLADRIARAAGLAPRVRAGCLATLGALSDGAALCHGDFHPFNVMGPADAPVVIDWADAAAGPPAADIARTHLLIAARVPALADGLAAATAGPLGLTVADLRAWRPVLAAARLAEGIDGAEAEALRAIAAGG